MIIKACVLGLPNRSCHLIAFRLVLRIIAHELNSGENVIFTVRRLPGQIKERNRLPPFLRYNSLLDMQRS